MVDASVVRSGRNLTIVAIEFKLKDTERLTYLCRATFYNMPVASLWDILQVRDSSFLSNCNCYTSLSVDRIDTSSVLFHLISWSRLETSSLNQPSCFHGHSWFKTAWMIECYVPQLITSSCFGSLYCICELPVFCCQLFWILCRIYIALWVFSVSQSWHRIKTCRAFKWSSSFRWSLI